MTDLHHHGVDRSLQRRALWVALGLNASYMVVEVVGGVVFNSLALLADAAHMMSDVVGLGIALFAQGLLSRPASPRHTYGLQRSEVLGALANGVALLAVVGWICFEALRRIANPVTIEGGGLLIVATIGLLINVGSAVILLRAQGRSLNMRAAFLHMASDAAGSVAVIAAGVGVLIWDVTWVDPVASFVVALLVLWATWSLLRETVHVLMEGVPKHMDVGEVEAALASQPGIQSVHHLHLWNLASDMPALSAHVVLADDETLHEAQERGDSLRAMLHQRFGIEHSTLELECHPCFEVASAK
jgi:cobalt-zinc-cadmium efflux system protein